MENLEKGTRPGGCREGLWGRKGSGKGESTGRVGGADPYPPSGPPGLEAGQVCRLSPASQLLLLTPAVSFPSPEICVYPPGSLTVSSQLYSLRYFDDLCNKSLLSLLLSLPNFCVNLIWQISLVFPVYFTLNVIIIILYFEFSVFLKDTCSFKPF